jgi:hypothetical protein
MEMAIGVLGISFEVSGGRGIEDEAGNINQKALGYIYGFVDAALQNRGLSIDHEYGYATLVGILNKYWPGKGGDYLLHLAEHMKEPEIIGGIAYGGQDYVDWMKQKQQTPMGLGKSLLDA